MFNKRMVYMAGPETQQQAPREEEKGPDAAKAMLDQFFPKPDQLSDKEGRTDHSMEDELNNKNDTARTDIQAVLLQGKEIKPKDIKDGNVPGFPKGFLRSTFVDMKKSAEEALNKAQKADKNDTGQFITVRADATTGDDKLVYFVVVLDNTSPSKYRYFYKEERNFFPAERTLKDEMNKEEVAQMEEENKKAKG